MKKSFLFLLCSFGLASQAQVMQLSEGFTEGNSFWILRVGSLFDGAYRDWVDMWQRGFISLIDSGDSSFCNEKA